MMANLNGMTLPSWASHVEDKLAPMPLLRVQAFVDTLDRDLGTDVLAHPDEARAWLADAGLVRLREYVRAQVPVESVDERLHQQQRHRRQLVLDVGGPRGQRHAVQGSRHDHLHSRDLINAFTGHS